MGGDLHALADSFTEPLPDTDEPLQGAAQGGDEANVSPISIGPAFTMSRAGLVKAHQDQWPTIERDLKGASTNGLAKAAKAGARDWHEKESLDWARQHGKLILDKNSGAALHDALRHLPARRHTLDD